MHAEIPSCYTGQTPKMQEMLVGLQVAIMFLSIWNLSLVIGDLPSFLGCFVMFCVLVMRRELMVWGLSIGVAVYCERRLLPLISLGTKPVRPRQQQQRDNELNIKK
jgi:hypothetical protein